MGGGGRVEREKRRRGGRNNNQPIRRMETQGRWAIKFVLNYWRRLHDHAVIVFDVEEKPCWWWIYSHFDFKFFCPHPPNGDVIGVDTYTSTRTSWNYWAIVPHLARNIFFFVFYSHITLSNQEVIIKWYEAIEWGGGALLSSCSLPNLRHRSSTRATKLNRLFGVGIVLLLLFF